MAQSVKLSNGNYVDASAVYDTDRQETVEDALKCSSLRLNALLAANGFKGDSSVAMKQGKLVSLQLYCKSNDATTTTNTLWLTLPKEYRPKEWTPISAQMFMTASIVYAYVDTDGTLKTYTSIPKGQWWGGNVVYLVD